MAIVGVVGRGAIGIVFAGNVPRGIISIADDMVLGDWSNW